MPCTGPTVHCWGLPCINAAICHCGVLCTAHRWLLLFCAVISWVILQQHELCFHILWDEGPCARVYACIVGFIHF
jgi:hypothetical protein